MGAEVRMVDCYPRYLCFVLYIHTELRLNTILTDFICHVF